MGLQTPLCIFTLSLSCDWSRSSERMLTAEGKKWDQVAAVSQCTTAAEKFACHASMISCAWFLTLWLAYQKNRVLVVVYSAWLKGVFTPLLPLWTVQSEILCLKEGPSVSAVGLEQAPALSFNFENLLYCQPSIGFCFSPFFSASSLQQIAFVPLCSPLISSCKKKNIE